jgi:hypothetical protein
LKDTVDCAGAGVLVLVATLVELLRGAAADVVTVTVTVRVLAVGAAPAEPLVEALPQAAVAAANSAMRKIRSGGRRIMCGSLGTA